MKCDSKNPLWFNSKLEQSSARIRMFKALKSDQCEVTIRPGKVYVAAKGCNVSEEQGIVVFVGDSSFGNSQIEMNLTLKEAREFANAIINMVNELENRRDRK